MAADDDLDELEAQLGDYDYDDEDDDDSPLVRGLKKNKLIIGAIGSVAVVLIVVAMFSGGDNVTVDDRRIMVVPELAVEPGKQAKTMPDQPGGEPVPGQENRVYNMVAEGENAGAIAITSPPEDPKNPPAAGETLPLAMTPEGVEKTPEGGDSAEGGMVPPTPPSKDGDAALPALPAPTAAGDGKTAESILPVPPADGKACRAAGAAPPGADSSGCHGTRQPDHRGDPQVAGDEYDHDCNGAAAVSTTRRHKCHADAHHGRCLSHSGRFRPLGIRRKDAVEQAGE
jgi:hypothetical protein